MNMHNKCVPAKKVSPGTLLVREPSYNCKRARGRLRCQRLWQHGRGSMQLRHLKTIHAPQEGIAKVTAICWSSSNKKLAIVTTDRVVHLCDENGERRDKFSTKPGDSKGPKTYLVRGMAWSPDSTKLAIAQSDNIAFVYKLGADWGDKKSICNKFQQASSVTSIVWPEQRPNELVFGLAEGKVKVGQLRSNKPATLYSTDSYVVSICANQDGTAILSGHLDHRIYRFYFDAASRGVAHWEFCRHSCVPYALSWGEAVRRPEALPLHCLAPAPSRHCDDPSSHRTSS